MMGDQVAAAYKCPIKGCFAFFPSAKWLRGHLLKSHKIKG